MEKTHTFYRVVPKNHSFSSSDFATVDGARDYKRGYVEGFPENEKLNDVNRKYWKEQGAGMKIYEVNETLTLIDPDGTEEKASNPSA